jgi:hypothetical protein
VADLPPLRPQQPPPPSYPPQYTRPPPQSQPARYKTTPEWPWILGGILVVLVVIGIANGGNSGPAGTISGPATTTVDDTGQSASEAGNASQHIPFGRTFTYQEALALASASGNRSDICPAAAPSCPPVRPERSP